MVRLKPVAVCLRTLFSMTHRDYRTVIPRTLDLPTLPAPCARHFTPDIYTFGTTIESLHLFVIIKLEPCAYWAVSERQQQQLPFKQVWTKTRPGPARPHIPYYVTGMRRRTQLQSGTHRPVLLWRQADHCRHANLTVAYMSAKQFRSWLVHNRHFDSNLLN